MIPDEKMTLFFNAVFAKDTTLLSLHKLFLTEITNSGYSARQFLEQFASLLLKSEKKQGLPEAFLKIADAEASMLNGADGSLQVMKILSFLIHSR